MSNFKRILKSLKNPNFKHKFLFLMLSPLMFLSRTNKDRLVKFTGATYTKNNNAFIAKFPVLEFRLSWILKD